jgi:uncharacterized integral membrane protein
MKKLLVRLVLLPILLIVAVFAISNRAPVELSLWPLPWEADAPLFLVLLATLLIGVLIGAVLVWAGGHRYRSAARHHRRSSERLQRQVDALRHNAVKPQPPIDPAPQILPPERSTLAPSGLQPNALQPPPSYTPVNRPR